MRKILLLIATLSIVFILLIFASHEFGVFDSKNIFRLNYLLFYKLSIFLYVLFGFLILKKNIVIDIVDILCPIVMTLTCILLVPIITGTTGYISAYIEPPIVITLISIYYCIRVFVLDKSKTRIIFGSKVILTIFVLVFIIIHCIFMNCETLATE
jgi:hypothetical protein